MGGIVAWCAAVGACLAVEGLALLRPELGWPTLSDLARVATSSVAGRVLLFSLWLWLGWHLFVRGWRFLLYAPAGSDDGLWSSPDAGTFEAVATLVAACVVIVVLVRAARRRGRGATRVPEVVPAVSPSDRLSGLLRTAAGGYVVFVALVGLYDMLTAGREDLVRDALVGGGLLALAVVAAAAMLLWSRTARRPRGS